MACLSERGTNADGFDKAFGRCIHRFSTYPGTVKQNPKPTESLS